jgi:L-lactate dehydrogenase complex protein LldG
MHETEAAGDARAGSPEVRMTSRAAFLATVRREVARPGARPPASGPLEPGELPQGRLPLPGSGGADPAGGDRLAAWFEQAATEVGTVVHHAATVADAANVLGALAPGLGVRRAVTWSAMALGALASVLSALEREGVTLVPCPTDDVGAGARAAFRDEAAAADLGLTGADLGIAASGSILLCSGRGRARSTSLLPPVHVALLPRARLVARLADAAPALAAWSRGAGPAPDAANAVLVTGPSRTADIELTLTRGVHGPREVHVVLVGG